MLRAPATTIGVQKRYVPQKPRNHNGSWVFSRRFSSENKKIFKHCGRDLNYRSSVFQAGFALYFADPAFLFAHFVNFL